jgi:adenylate kinase
MNNSMASGGPSNKQIRYNSLVNMQNVSKIAEIFSNGKPIENFKPIGSKQPYLIVVAGAPGVGKTTRTRKILEQKGLNYDNFYNVSLDALVEKIRPYRTLTKKLYNTLKAKKAPTNLANYNYALLSGVYLPTIMSNSPNFSLTKTEESLLAKIAAIGDPVAEEALKKRKYTPKKVITGLKILNKLREEGFKYAVDNGLNIIYDTTLTAKKDKIEKDLMPFLEENKPIQYKIIVILVTAPVKNIQNRIKGRHAAMLSEEEPYIRAIDPTKTEYFVEDNKKGFDIAKEYFEANKYKEAYPDSPYTLDDFEFIEVENPTNVVNKEINNLALAINKLEINKSETVGEGGKRKTIKNKRNK